MLINLLKKIIKVYKPIFAWNLLVSLLIAVLFYLKGFNQSDTYVLAFFIKLFTWAFSIGIYFMFYESTAYFFQNMGVSIRKIMTYLISCDVLIFISILTILFYVDNFHR
ncbi:hypothetical protein SAMN04488023_11919 [Pedobacter rhizosphaerae]|uniref:Uncharacterized protein n=1 Tax=Pedobacter rhizosphaerae TaxID=390241 RepID=A0A1H9SQA0_9SPHI|nr:hypothetical protein SAMN04488023_11919 [Pedobacter rhizosphaerae]